ncbi:cell division protein FtsQ/DivIB [Nocardioides sp.]|uniref:cell division protein FtsQ/DivIB n=1 Tax=Nocardioides sp. TaxID=35761 RepID=UPI003518DF95
MARTATRPPRREDTEQARIERTRRRFARRQWARRWLTWRRVLVAAGVAAAVGAAVWAVFFSSFLAVQGVEVLGARDLDPAAVESAARVPTGGPLATVDLVAIERRVAAMASVRRVDVSRKWPDRVLIQIEERVPVAVVARGTELRAVDADGVVFGAYRRQPADLPRIELLGVLETDVDALREAAAVAAALPSTLADVTDHLVVRGADDISLELRDGRIAAWGSSEASRQKAEVLLALLAQKASAFDVSVPGRPTLRRD